MLITLIEKEYQEMDKERAEKKKKTSNTPQQKVTGKPKADYQISKLPMSVSVNYIRILIAKYSIIAFIRP
jgi:hypothetical protein